MLYLEYCPDGLPVNDFGLEAEFSFLRTVNHNNRGDIIKYSTGNIFNRVREGIVDGEISHENVVFLYQGQEIIPNEYGAIVHWPNGFCDIDIRMSEHLVLGAMRIRKSKLDKEQEHGYESI